MNNQRIVFLDYLRVVACFMVILVHACEPFYLGGDGTYIANATNALWVTLIDSALRCAVPLFILTSSYLLFPVQGSTESFFRRRATRVLIPLAIWSILYAVIPAWGSGGEIDAVGNLKNLLLNFNMSSGHLWFVYMLVGVYIAMPIFSPWIERVSKRGEQWFLGLWLFSTLVPMFHQAALSLYGRAEVWGECNWNEFGSLYYVSGFMGYVVAGHYIRTYIDWSWRKTLAVALPSWVVGYAITAGWFYSQIPTEFPVNQSIDLAVLMEQSWRFCSTGVALTTFAIFLIFKKINSAGVAYPIVERVSKVSYGIYLMHIFVLTAVFGIVSGWGLATPWVIILSAVITFLTCAVCAWGISLLPKSKYLGF